VLIAISLSVTPAFVAREVRRHFPGPAHLIGVRSTATEGAALDYRGQPRMDTRWGKNVRVITGYTKHDAYSARAEKLSILSLCLALRYVHVLFSTLSQEMLTMMRSADLERSRRASADR
jgi:hypothetical protein